MKKIAILAVLAVLALPSAASAKVFLFPKFNQTSYGYQLPTYRPTSITLPENLSAVAIRWTGWGTRSGVGVGAGVGHMIYQPHDTYTFVATDITSDERSVRACAHEHPIPLTRYYGHLTVRMASFNDQLPRNFAATPTIEC